MIDNDIMYSKDEDLARILNEQFVSIFSKDDSITPDIKGPKGSPLNNLEITANGIIKLLEELNPHKASGPDGISARLLKERADQVGDTLAFLFTTSLDRGRYPMIGAMQLSHHCLKEVTKAKQKLKITGQLA